jgi:hypothetical protein
MRLASPVAESAQWSPAVAGGRESAHWFQTSGVLNGKLRQQKVTEMRHPSRDVNHRSADVLYLFFFLRDCVIYVSAAASAGTYPASASIGHSRRFGSCTSMHTTLLGTSSSDKHSNTSVDLFVSTASAEMAPGGYSLHRACKQGPQRAGPGVSGSYLRCRLAQR